MKKPQDETKKTSKSDLPSDPDPNVTTARMFVQILQMENGIHDFVHLFVPQAYDMIDWLAPVIFDSKQIEQSVVEVEGGHIRIEITIKAKLHTGEMAHMTIPVEI